MNKLEEYILRYQALHDGSDSYASPTGKLISPPELEKAKNKIIFDGSQLGKKLPQFIEQVIIYRQKAVTILDYGSGKAVHNFVPLKEHGSQTFHARFKGMIQCYYSYDPAVRIYDTKPPVGMVFDITCCADVMEHVPEEFVGHVLQEIASYTKQNGTALFTISGNLAGKHFKDGENLHATVKPIEWWVDHLKKAFVDKAFVVIYNDTNNSEDPLKLRYQNSPSFNAWNFKDKEIKIKDRLCVSEEV